MASNRFAKIEDQYWLDLAFMSLMSPENLHCARSSKEALAEAAVLRADYSVRCRELAAAA